MATLRDFNGMTFIPDDDNDPGHGVEKDDILTIVKNGGKKNYEFVLNKKKSGPVVGSGDLTPVIENDLFSAFQGKWNHKDSAGNSHPHDCVAVIIDRTPGGHPKHKLYRLDVYTKVDEPHADHNTGVWHAHSEK